MVSVVFVNYNSSRLLERALKSLREQEVGLNGDIIVVDNCSYDREMVREMCRHYRCRLMALKKNIGYGAAANRGVRLSRGEFVAVANPDIEFIAPTLAQLTRFLEENHRVGVVSPQLLYPDGTRQPSCRRFPQLRYVFAGRRSVVRRVFPHWTAGKEFLYLDIGMTDEPVAVEAVIGAFMLFRRAAFVAVGGFDEGYFMFAEDMDICRRLRKSGWEVFCLPAVRIRHYYGGVRRKWRRFTEFHRVKGLYRFFVQGRSWVSRLFLALVFAGYLFMLEAAGLVGLSEYEYSWQSSDEV